jgi:hypothetical protein
VWLIEQQFPVYLVGEFFDFFKVAASKSVRLCYHFDAECDGSSGSLIHVMRGYSCDECGGFTEPHGFTER